MHPLLTAIFLSIVGFTLLGFGANLLVTNAAIVARRFGLSARMIGLTLVAAGTSIPEISIALRAAISGYPELAVGDAIGSNIANIGLILGVTTLLVPLEIRSITLQKEWPILFLSMLVVGLLMLDGKLNAIDGGILMLGCIAVIFWLVRQGFRRKLFEKDILGCEYEKELGKDICLSKALFHLVLGFILLPISAYIIVEKAVLLARYFEVSNLTIGLTVSAFGSSLPELATSLAAARKKEYDIVIGNILGSTTFNLLAVLALPALIGSVTLTGIIVRDYAIMFTLVVLLFVFAFRWNGVRYISRLQGACLIAIYVAYLVSIYFLH